MRNINLTLCGLMALMSVNSIAITIEDMSEKNNKILELDQDIVIAEKIKKLTQLNNEILPPQTILLPKNDTLARTDNITVLSVHGLPSDPIVDVKFDGMLLQKRRGETLPGGWKIVAVENNTIIFNKKIPYKPDIIKTVNIGNGVMYTSEKSAPSEAFFSPSANSVHLSTPIQPPIGK